MHSFISDPTNSPLCITPITIITFVHWISIIILLSMDTFFFQDGSYVIWPLRRVIRDTFKNKKIAIFSHFSLSLFFILHHNTYLYSHTYIMGCCMSAESVEKRQRNNEIESQIKRDRVNQKNEIKMLLLGNHETHASKDSLLTLLSRCW